MADATAVRFLEEVYQRVDDQVRAIVETVPRPAEVDSIDVVIGDGVSVLTAGVAAALRVDFRARITGSFVQEFDGTTGSVVLAVAKAPGGVAPTFVSIVASAPPTITAARYGADEVLTGWTTQIDRGDVLRFSVTSAATIKRVLMTLRIRRLEP